MYTLSLTMTHTHTHYMYAHIHTHTHTHTHTHYMYAHIHTYMQHPLPPIDFSRKIPDSIQIQIKFCQCYLEGVLVASYPCFSLFHAFPHLRNGENMGRPGFLANALVQWNLTSEIIKDTSLIRTLYVVPKVFIIERFHYL